MFDLVNEISELIYVVDIETLDLLFVNQAGKDMFHLDDISGIKCYQAFQDLEQPCVFCPNSKLRHGKYHTWEQTNPVLKRHYLLKSKLIDWEGRKAGLEIAFDTTAGEREKIYLRNSLAAENLVTECAEILLVNQGTGNPFETVLDKIGSFLEADRVCIFEIENHSIKGAYEWCAPYVTPLFQSSPQPPQPLFDRWYQVFKNHRCIVIEDVGKLHGKNQMEYTILKERGICSIIASPFYLKGELSGYIGVHNYSCHKLSNLPAIFSSIGHFIGAKFETMKSLELLNQLSYYDALTKLGNRNKFNLDIQNLSTGSSAPIGMVYLNINGMKQINDKYGNTRGDKTLIHTADNMRRIFPLDRAYRIGGDEFIVICQASDQEQFEHKVRELRTLFAAETNYSVSIGRYWSEDTGSISTILFQAGEQMYLDKKKFYHGKALSGRYRHQLDDVLNITKPGALKQMIKDGKFLLYYQPKVDSLSYEMIGSEALVRCEITPGTIIPPGRFIPVLEESRLINILDFYIFRMVNAQIARWLGSGKEIFPVSVNFSRYTLCEHNFLQKIQDIWQEYQIPKTLLELEVTETVEEENLYDFVKLMKDIRSAGFTLSIDDFGIRNANLSLFNATDFDILKIDKSLIDNLTHNEKTQTLLAAITAMCRKMGIKVIIEGVETQDQLSLLQKLGCDAIQGYLFSRPLPLTEFEAKYM